MRVIAILVMFAMLGVPVMGMAGEKEEVVKKAVKVVKEAVKQVPAVITHPVAPVAPAVAVQQTSQGTLASVLGSLAIAAPFVVLFAYDVAQGLPIYKATGHWPSGFDGQAWDTCANASKGSVDWFKCIGNGSLVFHHR